MIANDIPDQREIKRQPQNITEGKEPKKYHWPVLGKNPCAYYQEKIHWARECPKKKPQKQDYGHWKKKKKKTDRIWDQASSLSPG